MTEPGAPAIANNDLVYLWWTFPSKIEGCPTRTTRTSASSAASRDAFFFPGSG